MVDVAFSREPDGYGHLPRWTTEEVERENELLGLLAQADNLITAGLGIGPLADPKLWNPLAREWLAKNEALR